MPIITFVDHTIPVAADFNDSYSFINTEVRTYERGGTGLSSYTKGDILYASATNTVAKLAIGVYGSMLGVSSSGLPAWARTLHKTGTDVTSSNTTAETDLLGNVSIIAGTLSSASRLRVTIMGAATNSTGATVVYTYRLKFAGSQIAASSSITTGASDRTLPVTFDLCADGSANAQVGTSFTLDNGTTPTVQTGTYTANLSSTFNLTATLAMNTASVNASYVMKYAMVELVA